VTDGGLASRRLREAGESDADSLLLQWYVRNSYLTMAGYYEDLAAANGLLSEVYLHRSAVPPVWPSGDVGRPEAEEIDVSDALEAELLKLTVRVS